MKKRLLIISLSFNLILLMAAVMPINESESSNYSKLSGKEQDNLNHGDTVHLSRAQFEIRQLLAWWEYAMPNELSYDSTTRTIKFSVKKVPEDNDVMHQILSTYTEGNFKPNLYHKEQFITSYVITHQDLDSVRRYSKDGVRIYEALRMSNKLRELITKRNKTKSTYEEIVKELPSIKSHVYVVPVKEDFLQVSFDTLGVKIPFYFDLIPGSDLTSFTEELAAPYVYDLTLPCPSTCDTTSPLYIR